MWALVLRGGGAVGSFLVTFMIARIYGPTGSGYFALGVQTALTVSALSLLGLDQITVRTIGGDLREKRAGRARAALRQSARVVATTSVIAAVLLLAASPLGSYVGAPPAVIAVASLIVLTYPMMQIATAGLRSVRKIVLSQVISGPMQSGLLAAMIGLPILIDTRLSAVEILLLYAVSAAVTCAFGWLALLKSARTWPVERGPRHPNPFTIGWPILMATGTHMLTGWALMAQVGAFAGADDVGAYRVTIQIMTIITLVTTTVESIVNPQYAGDFRVRRYDLARRRHRRATLMLLAAAGPLALVCILFAHPLLALFGPGFTVAATALQIMAGAQLANIATGPIGGLLLMAGRERVSSVLAIIGLVIALALTAWLVPILGVTGAAIGYAAALVFRNVASYVIVFRSPEMRGTLSSGAPTP